MIDFCCGGDDEKKIKVELVTNSQQYCKVFWDGIGD